MLPRCIIVTGTPGTGKTTLAKSIANNYKYHYVDVNKVIQQKKLNTRYDKKRACSVIDLRRLNKHLLQLILWCKQEKIRVIIDSHLSHYLPPRVVEGCIVITCNLKELRKRLLLRKYSKKKIEENIECEVMGICENEAKEMGHRVYIVDMTKGEVRRKAKGVMSRMQK